MLKNVKRRSYAMACAKCKKGFGMYVEGPEDNLRVGIFASVEEMQQRLLQALAIKRARRKQQFKTTGENGDTGQSPAAGALPPEPEDGGELTEIGSSQTLGSDKPATVEDLQAELMSQPKMPGEYLATLASASPVADDEDDAVEPTLVPDPASAPETPEATEDGGGNRPESPLAVAPPSISRPQRPESPIGLSSDPVISPSASGSGMLLGQSSDDISIDDIDLSNDAGTTLPSTGAAPRPPRPESPMAGKTLAGTSANRPPVRDPVGDTLPSKPLRATIEDDDITLAGTAAPAAASADATLPSAPATPPASSDATLPNVQALPRSLAFKPPVREIVPISMPDELSGNLGGYQIVKLLGQGGMGCVYLARQLSLDRQVAVKTMNAQWAQDPVFLSRFTREAYAAAQLVHHNVVQIYDIGEDRSTPYFSMEFVAGQSLQHLLEDKGKLDPEEAAGYILQAARGLLFAHEHGMIHRDIKPDNLMLNDHGVVKVADLGLVKTPASVEIEERAEADKPALAPNPVAEPKVYIPRATKLSTTAGVTIADIAMGTPAYMAPEQARDARGVDVRADIYSLGCSLYSLVTGKPIFEGKTIHEVMTKHQTEPVTPPEVVVSRVPRSLSAIIMKMVAKDPADRYPNMTAVIDALQDYLGLASAGPFTPREEHARVLEEAVDAYNDAEMARIRKLTILLFSSFCIAMMFCFGYFQWARPVMVTLAYWLSTTACYSVLLGVRQKSHLFTRLRQMIFGGSLADWATWGAGALVVAGLILATGPLTWLLLGVLGAASAAGFHFTVDRRLARQRATPLASVRDLLKSMRLRGLEEEALRRFVCKYSGSNWEPFYEALFGYEDMVSARHKWGRGDDGRPRRRYGLWRDVIVHWIDQRLRQRDLDRQRKHLEKIERAKLKAKGASDEDATLQAQAAADHLVTAAAQFRAQVNAVENTAEGQTLPAGVLAQPLQVHKVLYGDEDAVTGQRKPQPEGISIRIIGLGNLLFGARARFLVGVALVAFCVLWLRHNHVITGSAADLQQMQNIKNLQDFVSSAESATSASRSYQPLTFPGVPDFIANQLSGYGSGLAGLVLIASVFFTGTRMTVFLLPGLALLLLGNHIPVDDLAKLQLGPLHSDHACWLGGIALCVVGWFFGRRSN
ncbi:MAG: protein kinase [Phycisphaeraceae bacterium]|nr:protein kinase [Phycisphaeraceae bacterium]